MFKETLDENEKCQTPNCENSREWKFTFLKNAKREIEELCSDCVEMTIDDTSKRYINLEEIEKQKVFTMRRGK